MNRENAMLNPQVSEELTVTSDQIDSLAKDEIKISEPQTEKSTPILNSYIDDTVQALGRMLMVSFVWSLPQMRDLHRHQKNQA